MQEVSTTVNEEDISFTKSDVREAFERTEESLDDRKFEMNYSPWHFVEFDDVRKPVKYVYLNIEAVSEVADSRQAFTTLEAEEDLKELDVPLYNRKEHAEEILRDTFEEILQDYPERTGTASKDKRLYQLLRNKAPNFLKHVSNKNFEEGEFNFKGTAGLGNWPNIPWVAAKHPKETDTTQKGVYVVYLFDPEKQVIHATLNQGTTEVIDEYGKRKARNVLEDRAEEIREKVSLEGFSAENPDLSDNDKLYEESTIYQKKYELGDLTDPKQIGEDFVSLAEAYIDYLETKNDLEYPDVEEKDTKKSIEDFENEEVAEESDAENYFWVNAKPARWKVESIKDGGTAFYTAKNKKGNKRKTYSAFQEASKGDKVIFYESQPTQKVLALGEVAEGLHKEDREGYEEPVNGVSLKYSESIEEISWSELEENSYLNEVIPTRKLQGSFFEITQEAYNRIKTYEEHKIQEPEIDAAEELSTDLGLDFGDLYFPESEEESIKSQIKASLNSGKHIIFTGPPGTGKTELAEKVAEDMENSDDNVTGYQLTTATSDWSTFDTVGGYRPKNGEEGLEFKPGHILRRFKDDEKDLKNEALVIDEINRANIDKAFGQLFTVLSGQKVQLPFTKGEAEKEVEVVPGGDFEKPVEDHEFVVPESWRILATMNTYDKTSLYEMSYAFMRRFSFIRIEAPDLEDDNRELMKGYLDAWELEDLYSEEDSGIVLDDSVEDVAEIWKRVNNAVEGREIGPAIAKDMIEFLDVNGSSRKAANTAAITNFIFPQLEGVPDRKKIVSSLLGEGLDLDENRLKSTAGSMLQVEFDGEK